MSNETLALPAPEAPKLLPAPKKPTGGGDHRKRWRVIAIVAIAILLLMAIGWFFHHRQASKAKEATRRERERLPSVSSVVIAASPSVADLRLPGTVTAVTETALFARATGYVRARYVDIGDTVTRGQILAEIDAPDLDQEAKQAREQVRQAQAAVNDAKARAALSRVTYDRLLVLVKDQAVAQQQVDQAKQDLDTANAGVASSTANVGAAQANGARAAVLQKYEQVRAPFDGIVTARNVDVGAFITTSGSSASTSGSSGSMTSSSGSGSSASSGSSPASAMSGGSQGSSTAMPTELFRIAQADQLRVYVAVPQENTGSIDPGTEASVYVQGFEQPFDGHVARTARALDPSARTLLTEVRIGNEQHRLVPGMYAQVRFRSPRQSTPLLVPGEAVMARADGLAVAVLEPLRDEDRKRLPKREPKSADDKSSNGDDSAGGKSGDDKSGGKSGGRKSDEKAGSSSEGDAKRGEAKDPDKSGKGDEAPKDDDPRHALRVHLQPVQVGRDYGTEMEVVGGLAAGATIVANPGDEIVENALVIPQPQKKKKQDAGPQSADQGSTAGHPDAGPAGNQSSSMAAPTKGRK